MFSGLSPSVSIDVYPSLELLVKILDADSLYHLPSFIKSYKSSDSINKRRHFSRVSHKVVISALHLVGKIKFQVSPLTLHLDDKCCLNLYCNLHWKRLLRGRFLGSLDSSCQVNIIMLSLVYTPHQMGVPVKRVA